MRLLVSLLAMLATPAGACAVAEAFFVTDVAQGPVVVVADVTGYSLGQNGGLLSMTVSEVWKGTAPAHLTARWGIALAEAPPATWGRPRQVIAALTPVGQGFDLVVQVCGQAHLVPDTPAARRDIRAALAP